MPPLFNPKCMLLAVDVGNTDIVIGLYTDQKWLHSWRIPSSTPRTAQEYISEISFKFLESGVATDSIQQLVYSSVVPGLNTTLLPALNQLISVKPLLVGKDVNGGLKIDIDYPHEIGSDLIANAAAAFHRYKRNCVIVDFGTALTFTTVSGKGHLLGVAIVPGLKTAVRALFTNTAQLPEVPLVLPTSTIGKNTVHSIQAGILWGYEGLVKSLIKRTREELHGDCIAIATGGLSSIIETLKTEFVEIDQNLTLDGLRTIAELSRASP